MFEANPRLFILSISDTLWFKIFIDFTSFRLANILQSSIVFNNDIYPLTAVWQSKACELLIKILNRERPKYSIQRFNVKNSDS